MNRRLDKYIEAMLTGIAERLASAVPGERNHALNSAAFRLGQARGAGLDVGQEEARRVLWQACEINGYARGDDARSFSQTFASGWHGGLKSPRALPDSLREAVRGGSSPRPRPQSVRLKAEPSQSIQLPRPPQDQVLAMWNNAKAISQDEQVYRWLLHERGVDPGYVEANNLARVLPTRGALPEWARFGGQPWNETGHRLILPCWTACEAGQIGNLVTLRARLIGKHEGVPKTVSPFNRPEPYSVKRTIYANAIGMAALTLGGPWDGKLPPDRYVQPVAVISEGDIDFLLACQKWGDTRAVFGIYAGAWCAPIAARFPDGLTVVIMTDDDPAGARYADKIARSLQGRCDVRDIQRCNRG